MMLEILQDMGLDLSFILGMGEDGVTDEIKKAVKKTAALRQEETAARLSELSEQLAQMGRQQAGTQDRQSTGRQTA